MRACRRALEQAAVVARARQPLGVERRRRRRSALLEAALRGARLNVEINLGSLTDAAYVDARHGGDVERSTARRRGRRDTATRAALLAADSSCSAAMALAERIDVDRERPRCRCSRGTSSTSAMYDAVDVVSMPVARDRDVVGVDRHVRTRRPAPAPALCDCRRLVPLARTAPARWTASSNW